MLADLIEHLAVEPNNSATNFAIAQQYEARRQLGAAVGFYLRTAERSADNDLTYAALCGIANAFSQQQGRPHSVANALLQAVALQPNRPEAYYLLAKHYELTAEWQLSYTNACIGLSHSALAPLPHKVDYPGSYALLFQKAVAGWWIGRKYEALDLLHRLNDNPNLDFTHKLAVQNNLDNLT